MTDPAGNGEWRFDDLMHLGSMLKRAGGVPARGNQRSEWEACCRLDSDHPEHR